MRRFVPQLVLACSLALSAGAVTAQNLRPKEARVVMTEGFLEHHPDLKWRKLGLEAYRAGRKSEALNAFVQAARFADKPSQAMLAEMLWEGDGVQRDRPRAYAWADLAAERGWPDLLGKREHYWHRLDRAQREEAIEVGLPLLREFGDDAAKPRINTKIKRGRRSVTGSRVGHVGYIVVRMPANAADPMKSGDDVDGSAYYADKYYDPEAYHAWHERVWRERGDGFVEIGELEQEPDETGQPAQ